MHWVLQVIVHTNLKGGLRKWMNWITFLILYLLFISVLIVIILTSSTHLLWVLAICTDLTKNCPAYLHSKKSDTLTIPRFNQKHFVRLLLCFPWKPHIYSKNHSNSCSLCYCLASPHAAYFWRIFLRKVPSRCSQLRPHAYFHLKYQCFMWFGFHGKLNEFNDKLFCVYPLYECALIQQPNKHIRFIQALTFSKWKSFQTNCGWWYSLGNKNG